MEKDKFKKGIDDIKSSVRMDLALRDSIYNKLENYIDSNPVKNINIKSPWYVNGYDFILSRHIGFVLSIFVLTFISFNSVFLAGDSLPGDTLYPLKVDILEPIQYSLAVGSISKTNVLLNNLDTRLKEIETLQIEGKLSDSIQTDLEVRLKNNTKKIAETVKRDKTNDSVNLESNTESSGDFRMKGSEPTLMMVSSEVSTTSSDDKIYNNKKSKADEILKNTKKSIERIKKNKDFNQKLINVAEESVRETEDSLKEVNWYEDKKKQNSYYKQEND